MSNSPKRTHLEDIITKDPKSAAAFVRICAILMATGSKDMECDIQYGNKQYHFDVSEVATLPEAIA